MTSGVGEVYDEGGRIVGHSLSEESPESGVDYVMTIVWDEEDVDD